MREYELEPVTRAVCGTYSGWNAHIRHGERRCRPCLDAAAKYMREFRLRTGRTRWSKPTRNARPSGLGWPA